MALVQRIVKKGRNGEEASGDIPGRVLVAMFDIWVKGHVTNARMRDALGLLPEDEGQVLLLKNAYDNLATQEEKTAWIQLFSNVTQTLEERMITVNEASLILGL